MTNITVAICGILYLIPAIGFAIKHQWSWSLAYFSYAMANVGLILAAMGK